MAVVVARNWALLQLRNFDELRKSVKIGLAAERNPELLLQDGMLKISDRDFAGAFLSTRRKTLPVCRAYAFKGAFLTSRRRTLPTLVLGNSFQNSTIFGTL